MTEGACAFGCFNLGSCTPTTLLARGSYSHRSFSRGVDTPTGFDGCPGLRMTFCTGTCDKRFGATLLRNGYFDVRVAMPGDAALDASFDASLDMSFDTSFDLSFDASFDAAIDASIDLTRAIRSCCLSDLAVVLFKSGDATWGVV
jgi:hypothetical protein